MSQPKPVRLALLGPGGFGEERARVMHASPAVDFVASYSPIAAESLSCQRLYGAKAAPSAADIWDDPTIDGVVLATPNHLHLEQVQEACAAGKHIFVEKPLAPNLADSRRIVEACRQAGVLLMVGHNARRRSRIRTMKTLLDQGALGQPLAAEANNSHAGGHNIQPGNWRWSSKNCPGGPLSQLGIHHIDTLHYLLGPVARVSAWQRRLAIQAEIDDTTVALLEFQNGALGYLGAHYAVPSVRFIHILGTKANVRWDRSTGLMLETPDDRRQLAVEENDTILEEIDEFCRCITTGSSPEVGGAEAVAAVAVIEAAVLSNQRRRPVDISELLD